MTTPTPPATPTTNQFYLVLENYDATLPPTGIMITSGLPDSFVSPYWWQFDKTTSLISQQDATKGNSVLAYFTAWDNLPDYTGAASLISQQTGKTPLSRKYVIVPDATINAARVYISKTKLDKSISLWGKWVVDAAGNIPAFSDDNARLATDVIVDKAEFTYSGRSLTINTTTVDFLSIPMTAEAIFNVADTWGNQRGPMGITNTLAQVAAAFTSAGNIGSVNWANLNVSNSGVVSRILSPFRYMNGNPPDISSWNTYFDAYLAGLTTVYNSGSIQYPMLNTFQAQGYFIGKISTDSKGHWVVDACDQNGNVITSSFFTIKPSAFTGNALDIFAVTESNIGARDVLAGINRGIAHINDNINGWANIFGTLYPSSDTSPSGQWPASTWSNSQSYYPSGNLPSGQAIVSNQYSALLHQQSITGSETNRTASAFPTAINQQNYCYGFSVDDIWAHGSAVYGQGVDSKGNGTTVSATLGIFSQS